MGRSRIRKVPMDGVWPAIGAPYDTSVERTVRVVEGAEGGFRKGRLCPWKETPDGGGAPGATDVTQGIGRVF